MAIPSDQLALKLPVNAAKTLGKALANIQKIWNLNNSEMAKLLHLKANTYGNWIHAKEVPVGKAPYAPEIEIVIAAIAIFRSLGSMFQNADDQVLWLKTPHPHLQNQSPIAFAEASCANVFYLRHYLDYVRGRGA